jgi:IPT/TIG domain-containing protein
VNAPRPTSSWTNPSGLVLHRPAEQIATSRIEGVLSMRRIIPAVMITVSAAVFMFFAMPSAGAAATITSFSPTSGPAGCVVAITGTGFTDFPAAFTTVSFVGPTADETPATPVVVVSATEIFATVPGLTVGTSYTIRISNPAGTSTSAGTFTSTIGAGGCAPTISSFTPTSGAVGTAVTIVGTNLLKNANAGGDVTFFDNKTATPSGGPVSPTHLTVLVPDGAATGPITLTTPSGTASSATSFTVIGGEPPPAPGGAPTDVLTTTEPEVCANVDTFGTPPVLPTAVSVAAASNLLVYFSSEWSGLNPDTELLISLRVNDDAGNFVVGTPFEWGVSNNPRLHDSGTVMWSFDSVPPGDYEVLGDARTDPVPGPKGGGNTNNNPTAVLENCALAVFVIPVTD